jgi:hypothetical protein
MVIKRYSNDLSVKRAGRMVYKFSYVIIVDRFPNKGDGKLHLLIRSVPITCEGWGRHDKIDADFIFHSKCNEY